MERGEATNGARRRCVVNILLFSAGWSLWLPAYVALL